MRLFARSKTTLVALGIALLAPTAAFAETRIELDPVDSQATWAGSYLAGRSADRNKDIGAAAFYFGRALATDPTNAGLMERVLLLGVATGDMERSFALAERLIDFDGANPYARLALAVKAISAGRFDDARASLLRIARSDLAWITSGLMLAWLDYEDGKVDEAIVRIADLSGPEWYTVFKDYHSAILFDAAGRHEDAVIAIGRAYRSDITALRIIDGYARIMARAGEPDKAIEALVAFGGDNPPHPAVRELLGEIRAGSAPAPVAQTSGEGIAELLYGLGSAIGLDDGPDLSAAYLRLAGYLAPDNHLITLGLGDAFQGAGRCIDAIDVYETVPAGSGLRRTADIQTGVCYMALERYDDAVTSLLRVADANPGDVEAAMQLGHAYRADSRFEEAAEAYATALAAVPDADHADWRLHYFHGVSLERSKRWPEAEAAFQKALEINPDQPQVLNYLGYTWVDKAIHLDVALDMIKKAVEQRPNDGYIVDSLGWAYYRLGRYEEAVTTLETAVQLRAQDPVINDHLGDAYWMVGRKREAMFQWAHARDLEPDEAELPKILAKLERGLEPPHSSAVQVERGESLWDIALRVYGDAGQMQRILDANKDKITDPNLIYPGMELVLPAPETN